MAMIYGTHGEIPKIVIAPSTVEEAFYDTVEAFNLQKNINASYYLNRFTTYHLGKQTVEPLDYR